jgi:chemotaxis response regulator CheB
MPQESIQRGAACKVMPLSRIATAIREWQQESASA